jgi:hypothetical protein
MLSNTESYEKAFKQASQIIRMRIAVFTLCLVLLAAVPSVLSIDCLSEERISIAIHECEEKGFTPSTVTVEGGCTEVRCLESTRCAEQAMRNEEIALECKSHGGTVLYSEATAEHCSVASCTLTEACAEVKEKNAHTEASCKETGGYIVKREYNGCVYYQCVGHSCDERTKINEGVEAKCTAEGLTVLYTEREGCKVATGCKEPETVSCKKLVREDCVLISCTDGYHFNSCENSCTQPTEERTEEKKEPQCTTAKDDQGCTVLSCEGVVKEKHCPEKTETAEEPKEDPVREESLKNDDVHEEGFFKRLLNIFG